MRAARSRWLSAIAISALVGAGCASNLDAAPASTTVRAPAPTAAPTTTTATPTTVAETDPSTTVVATTAATTTTVAPTTTLPPTLPVPFAAPEDSRGNEPVIDLGTIEIPKIGLDMTMYEGIRLTTLDRGPGHWPGTALPGDLGNVVVAGHRTSHAKPFRHLDQLVPGDEVVFTNANGRFVYHVTSTEIVAPDAIWIVDQTPAFTGTLFACHPPGSTKQRIVVHLELTTA